MKKLFFILSLFAAVACRAQLPSVVEMGQDSIRITRGELVLRNSTANVKGFLYNTGGGVTTFKRISQLNDTTYIFGEDTLRFNASIEGATTTTASRGLHKFGSDIRWGLTPLDSAVDIDQVGNGITFHDGPFIHVWGDYSQASPFAIFEDGRYGGYWSFGDAAGRLAQFQQTISDPYPVGEWKVTDPDHLLGSLVRLLPHKLTIGQYDGELYLEGLIDSAQGYVLGIDPSLKKLTYFATPTGGGGGTTSRFGFSGEDYVATEDRDFDQAGNGVTLRNGAFSLHTAGDQLDFGNPFASFDFRDNYWQSKIFNPDGHFNTITNSITGDGQIAFDVQGVNGTSSVHINGDTASSDAGILFAPVFGNLKINGLMAGSTPYVLYYDPTPGSGRVLYDLAPTSGGGEGGGLSGITADGGLHATNDSTNVRMGGSFIENVGWTGNGFNLSLSGAFAGSLYDVTNSSTSSNKAISGTATGGTQGTGIFGSGSQFGVYGTSTNSIGARGISTNGIGVSALSDVLPFQAQRTSSLTNSIGQIAEISMFTSGTPAAGFGGYLGFYLETDGSSAASGSGRIVTKWTTATHASRTSEMEFYTTNSTVERKVLGIAGSGQLRLPIYVGSTFDGEAVKGLGVNIAGDVVTIPSTGVSSDDVTAAIDASNNFDPTYFDGDGTVGNVRTLKPTVVALQTDVTDLNARIDSVIANIPLGAGSNSKTQLQNASGTGDTLSVKVNDSLFTIKRFKPGANVTFTVDGNSITINSTPGSAEVNTLSITLSGTGSLTVSVEAMLEYVLVNPTTSLAGFKIGTVADDDYYYPAIPIPATALAHELIVQRYIPSSTAIYFSGITSSTTIDLIFKPIHR